MTRKQKKKILTLAVVAIVVLLGLILSHHGKKKPALKTAAPSAASHPLTPRPKTLPPVRPQQKTVKTPAPLPVRQIPTPGKGPKLIFVIDDLGNSNQHTDLFMRLGSDVNYAVLPLLKHTLFFNQLSRRTGADVILHLPLESIKNTIPGPGLITSRMQDEDVLRVLRHNLDTVPQASGVNNHMGSRGTADPRIMGLVLRELKTRNLFFLDSRTTSNSVAPEIAARLSMPILRRDIFLDNVDTKEAIRKQIAEMTKLAVQQGYAVGIGHDRENTLSVLLEMIPELRRKGYQIISLRQLLKG